MSFLGERFVGGRNSEYRYWKGTTDITITKRVVVPAHDAIPVPFRITRDNLPKSLSLPVRRNLRPSVRSTHAQTGISVGEDSLTDIILGLPDDFTSRSFFAPTPLEAIAALRVLNHSARPVELAQGARIFRLFSDSQAYAATAEELDLLLRRGLIQFAGKEGKDWEVVGNRIKARILDESRRFIAPSDEPMHVDDRGDHYQNRVQIDEFLEPIPETQERIFWIGETMRLLLKDPIDAIVDGVEGNGSHSNSQLIDGGRTNHPIRVEVVSPTTPHVIPNSVYFYFVKR